MARYTTAFVFAALGYFTVGLLFVYNVARTIAPVARSGRVSVVLR